MRAVLLWAWITGAIACTTSEAFEASTGESPAELLERECRERHLTCGLVYAFAAASANPLGRVELCVIAEDLERAESLFGESELSPDPRFAKWALLGVPPVCLWACPSAVGANAYDGSFCVEAP